MMTRSQTIANAAAAAANATSNVISSDDDTTKVVYPSMFSRWAEPL
jgi:hypothetical protein